MKRIFVRFLAASMVLCIGAMTAPEAAAIGPVGTTANPSGGTTTKITKTTTGTVDTASGNQYLTVVDYAVPGAGLRFAFVRAYNSLDSYSGPLCRGWTHSYNVLLTVAGANVVIKEADGHTNVFAPGATAGTFTPPAGNFDVLSSSGANTFLLTRRNQTVFNFGPIPLNPSVIRLLSITDKNGNSQTLAYDTIGNLIMVTDVGGATFLFTYDANGHLTSLKDTALNRTVSYSCSSLDLTGVVDPTGQLTSYTYSSDGRLISISAASRIAISNSYDSVGRVVSSSRYPAGTGAACTTTFSYDDVNRVTTVTDPLGAATKHYYSGSGVFTKLLNAVGAQTLYTHDGQNQVVSMTNPLGGVTHHSYDARGNRISTTDPLVHTTNWVFDSKNNLTRVTDANDSSTNFAYDARGNLSSVTDAAGGTTSYSYDSRGNKTAIVNAKGSQTSNTFDSANHLVSSIDATGKATTFTYDAGGNLLSQTEPDGNKRTYSYDALRQLTGITYLNGPLTATGPVSYSYDAHGNRVSMVDPTGTTRYAYDSLDRLTSVTFPGNRVVSYGYDCNDNRTSTTYSGKTVSYSYDAVNRLLSASDGSDVTQYTYDAAGNPLSVDYPNGAAVSYIYDAANRMTRVANTYIGSDSGPISSFTYSLDNVGNRLQVIDGAGNPTTFTYDPLYRLIGSIVGAKATAYTYDAVGNRLTQTAPGLSLSYTYDAADRLISAGSTLYAYDANGNQISRKVGKNTTTFAYDAANRLVSASGGGNLTSLFTYDGDGRRVGQNVGSATYAYLNDVAAGFTTVLNETGPDGDIKYVWGVALISADGPTFMNFYHYDGQSSVAGVTDLTGHLEERYVYDVWGRLLLSVPNPGIGTQNKIRYTGEASDPGTGLIYLGGRYYDASLGRFITGDQLEGSERSPQTLNRFVYVTNNPATFTDRTKLAAEDAVSDVP